MADTQTAPATDDGLQADLNTVQPASGATNPLAPPSTAAADDGISADINSIQPDSNAPQPSNLPKVSATGKSVEPVPNYQQGFVSFAKHLAGGYEGLDTVGPGMDMLFTDKSFEDSQKEIQQQQIHLSQMYEEDKNNTIRYVQANNWTAAAGTTVSNVVAEGAAPLGISLAGGGALALGAAAVGLPVAVPFAVGTILAGGVIGLGTTVYNMSQHGADRNVARASGLAAVAAGVATSFIGLQGTLKPGLDLINNPQLKQTALQLTLKLAKSAGVGIGAMEANNVTDAAIKYVGTLTASPDKKYTPKEIWNEFLQASIGALIFPPILTLGFTGLGAVLGKAKPHITDNERITALTAEYNRRERLQAEENARAEYDKLYGKEAAEIQRSLQKTLKGEVEVSVPGEPKALIGDVQLTDAEKEVIQVLKTEAVKAGVPGTPEEIQGKLTDWVVKNRDQAKWLTDHTMPKKVDLGETTVKVKQPRTRTPKSAPNYDTSYIQKVINKLPKNKNGAPKLEPLIAQLTGEVIAVFQGKKPVNMETTSNPVQNIFNLPKRLAYRYNASNSAFYELLETAGQDTPPEDRTVLQGFAEYLHDVVQTLKEANTEGVERLNDHLEEATGLDKHELEIELAKMGSTKLKDQDGNVVTYKNFLTGKISEYKNVSEAEALQDYAWAQDPEAQDGLRARGFTLRGDFPLTDTDPITGEVKEVLTRDLNTGEMVVVDDPRTWELQVERALGPEKLKIIKGAVAESKEAGPELQTAFKQATGETLKIKDIYYGQIVREAKKTDVDAFENFQNQLKQRTVGKTPVKKTNNPSTTIERVKNAIPTVPTNFYLNAIANVRLRNQLIYTWQAGEVFNGVFNNQTVRTVVKHKGGAQLMGMIDASIEEGLHGPGRTQTSGETLSNWIMGKFGVVALGNNSFRAVMHASQLPMYSVAKNMNPVRLAAGVTDFWTNPVVNAKRVMNRPFIKGRYDSAMETFLNAVQSDDPSTLLRGKIDQLQMIWLPLGDQAAAVQGWHAVFITEKSLGKSTAEAARAADIATNSVMYSSSSDQLSHFGAGRVLINGKVYRISATKLVAVAAQIPTKMFSLQITAIRDAINHPSTATITHAALVLVAVRVANASFAAVKLAWDLSTLKSPERKAKAIREFETEVVVGPLPPIEKVLTAAPIVAIRNSVTHKHDTPAEWSIYVQKVVNDIGAASTKMDEASKHHGASKKANIEVSAAIFKVLDELYLGIGIAPVSAAKRLTTGK